MELKKSLLIISSIICLHFQAKANKSYGIYTPKEISITYTDEIRTLNHGKSEVYLPIVKVETTNKEWMIDSFSYLSTNQIASKDIQNLVNLSIKFGFKLDANYLSLYEEINSWLGTRYRYASQSRNGIDCSGFTNMLYKKVYNKVIDRSSSSQAHQLRKVVEKDKLQPGNLVFFATNRRSKKRITHVGIYLGSGYFAHASTHSGVTINELNEDYYLNRYITGGEI